MNTNHLVLDGKEADVSVNGIRVREIQRNRARSFYPVVSFSACFGKGKSVAYDLAFPDHSEGSAERALDLEFLHDERILLELLSSRSEQLRGSAHEIPVTKAEVVNSK